MTQPPIGDDTGERLARALGPHYEIRRLVGRGGFAEVYEVWDKQLERRLALKALRPDIAWTAGMLDRFKHETRAVAKLEHANILSIHFVGEGEGVVYYAMPYIDGRSLGDLLRHSGALPPDQAVSIAVPILDALAHAHDHGLIHRDIKPDNIMLDHTRGRPLLVDFGIVKRLDAEAGLTQAGFVVGTPHYMSPEQALGERDLDARTDIYSMGAVLYQMLTGSPPFDGESSQEIVGKHIAEPPPAPAATHGTPAWLSSVITRCMQKKPSDRPQSAAAVRDALRAGPPGDDRPPVSVEYVARSDVAAAEDAHAAETEVVESGTAGRAGTAGRTGRAGGWKFAAIAGMVLLTALAAFWLTRPRAIFENALDVPVVVSAAGRERTVQPGERVRAPLRRGRAVTITWAVVRPNGPDGQPLGVAVAETVQVTRRFGRERLTADASAGAGDYFAPLITNDTDRPLAITVNAGLAGARSCECLVPPGATRMPIGYYPLYRNSTVRAEDQAGRSATFTDLGPEVDRRTGRVGLRFETRDLR